MNYKIDICHTARYFSVPCKAVDGCLKTAPSDYFKVLLYILSSESDELSTSQITAATAVSADTVDNAVLFWNKEGTFKLSATSGHQASRKTSVSKEAHAKYSAKEVAGIVKSDKSIKLLFDQLESTLGRELRFAERCGYINLVQYYGFSVQSIILLVEYCKSIGKLQAKYIETVAKGIAENGMTDYRDVEKEIERMSKSRSYEGKVKALLGISSNLSTKQSAYVESWRLKDYTNELIKAAYDVCLDNISKVSFPYIDKVLLAWNEAGFTSLSQVEAAQVKRKKEKTSAKEHSYSLEDFEKYSIDFVSNKNK